MSRLRINQRELKLTKRRGMYSLLGFRTRGVFDISELNITAGDDVAFGTALMRCGGTEANGDKVELDFRLPICFRKIDGRWTIMHEALCHLSGKSVTLDSFGLR